MNKIIHDAFISYDMANDSEAVHRISTTLIENGVDVWVDKQDLPENATRDEVKRFIDDAVTKKARFFLPVFSSKGLERWSYKNIEFFKWLEKIYSQPDNSKNVIFLRLDDCKLPKFTFDFPKPIDFFPESKWEISIHKLVNHFWFDGLPIDIRKAEIIGFDLGHGETAVAKINFSAKKVEPEIVEITSNKKSIITAVSEEPNKRVLIGEEAFLSSETSRIDVLFKSRDVSCQKTSRPIRLFVSKCIKQMKDAHRITNDNNTYFLVGHPSGWSAKERIAYRRLLTESGMRYVRVMPESRAAFIDAKVSGFTDDSFKGLPESALVIDVGSSTTDFTVVMNSKENPLDFGNNELGGSLIDKAILDHVVYNSLDKDKVLALFKQEHFAWAKCVLTARIAKEKYFSKDEKEWHEDDKVHEEMFKLPHALIFDFSIKASEIRAILDKPIVNNESWSDAFRSQLLKCKEKMKEELPRTIFLTGGASRMHFLQKISKDIFPDSELRVGNEPELTIAKGLSLAGRTIFRIKAFRDEFDKFLENDLLHITEKKIPRLLERITTSVCEIITPITIKKTEHWRDTKNLTFNDAKDLIKKDINTVVLLSDSEVLRPIYEKWYSEISDEIVEKTNNLCMKYGIPIASFKLNTKGPNLRIFSDVLHKQIRFSDILSTTLSTVIGGLVTTIIVYFTASLTGTFSALPLAAGSSSYILIPLSNPVTISLAIPFAIYGLMAGGYLGVAVKKISREPIEELIQEKHIPITLRKLVYNESIIREAVEKQLPELRKEIKKSLEEAMTPAKIRLLAGPIKEELSKAADIVALLVK